MNRDEILAKLEAAYNSPYKRLDSVGLTEAEIEAAADKIGRGWSTSYRLGHYLVIETAGPNDTRSWTVTISKPRRDSGLDGILTTPEEDFGTKKGGGSNEPA